MKLVVLLATFPVLALASSDQTVDEVVVKGTRGRQLTEMMKQMVALEDDFYVRYNELNTRDRFDTYCENETRAGSKFRRRYCKAVFEMDAIEAEARGVAWNYYRSVELGSLKPSPLLPDQIEPASLDIQSQRKAYRENMIEVVSRDPQLFEMARRRAEMEKRYDEMRRQAFGLKPKAAEDHKAP